MFISQQNPNYQDTDKEQIYIYIHTYIRVCRKFYVGVDTGCHYASRSQNMEAKDILLDRWSPVDIWGRISSN